MLLNVLPSFTLIWLSFANPDATLWWPYSVPLYIVVGNIALFIGSTMTIGFPVALHMWRKLPRPCVTVPLWARKRGSFVQVKTSEVSTSTYDVRSHNTCDPLEMALHQCLSSRPLQDVYMKFTIEEFTTGDLVSMSYSMYCVYFSYVARTICADNHTLTPCYLHAENLRFLGNSSRTTILRYLTTLLISQTHVCNCFKR
jgi:hypothetical protein